jgi:hypothetical protein
MPEIKGRDYNNVLWEMAAKLLSLSSYAIPGVKQVFFNQESIAREYEVLVKRLKAKFRRLGVPFDESNFFEVGKAPPGRSAIIIQVVPHPRK